MQAHLCGSARGRGMDDLADLRAAATTIEQSTGYSLCNVPLALSPPLGIASPSPRPPTRKACCAGPSAVQSWTDDEIGQVLALFHRYGPRFRKIARHIAGRSEDAVRQLLKRRGLLVPRSSPVRRRSSKAPRWSRSEDRRLLQAYEETPRHKRGNVPWCKVKAAAGLDRHPHSLRNRLARLAAMEA